MEKEKGKERSLSQQRIYIMIQVLKWNLFQIDN